jgi:hypothetical protein
MWCTIPSGIVFGPYGSIGYVGTLQRKDLEQIAKTCVKLFHWAKRKLL